MLYNTTTATDFIGLMSYIQFEVGIPFAQLTMLAIFFTSFFALKRYETIKAFTSSIFLTFLSSLFFWLMGLLEVFYVLGSAVVLAVTVILLYFYRET
ncbi:MAG: hypothetical protein QXG39_08520 [Candidatus Aenigmatarchaeota archaeon]